ncbi:phosphate ABC transporter permease PstA [Clostridium boliviensis]|uniref:Phosphate transport system permease protein PstA n=1 Tax=Clostridium boliviensis TaxID=318465 RepID=A0ABU4GMX5_9CLOT|nr:phosphate ABC transporter permease PstA [Clostridium boliviensis]MDW2798951.1 phosphate ABC transporter permease PstA [Clostridium boliviensis]
MKSDTIELRIKKSKSVDKGMTILFYIVGGFILLFLLFLAGAIIISGLMGFYPGLLSFGREGVGNQLFNTIYLVFLSLLISVPIGVAAGIYMAEYAKEGKILSFLRISIESLSSLPSIVVGLFGYLVFILMTGAKWNLMAGALAVSILSLPLITTTTEDAIRNLPIGYKNGSYVLGATQWQTIFKVLLPACLPRIITGVILAAGRGFGEAAALLYTAGQSTNINWSNWNLTSPTCALNPFRPGETLALHIWVMRTEGSLNPHATEIANFSSAILVMLILGFSLTARIMSERIKRKSGGSEE